MVSCSKKNAKEFIIKKAYINSNEKQLVVKLFNSKKKIGKIHGLYIGRNGTFSDAEITVDDKANYTVTAEINDWQEKYINGQHYLIQVIWYGGRLESDSIFNNGLFEIMSEHYSNKI